MISDLFILTLDNSTRQHLNEFRGPWQRVNSRPMYLETSTHVPCTPVQASRVLRPQYISTLAPGVGVGQTNS